jgi:hypothetical protein
MVWTVGADGLRRPPNCRADASMAWRASAYTMTRGYPFAIIGVLGILFVGCGRDDVGQPRQFVLRFVTPDNLCLPYTI